MADKIEILETPRGGVSKTSHSRDGKFWFWKRVARLFKKHWLLSSIFFLVVLYFAFIERPLYQPLFIAIRIYSVFIVAGIVLLTILIRVIRKSAIAFRRVVALVLLIVTVVLTVWKGVPVYKYMSLYARYQSLNVSNLNTFPLTSFDRVQPKQAIHTLASETMSETEAVTTVHCMRNGEDYRWNMAVEPPESGMEYIGQRFFGHVTEILSLSATTSAPNFSRENRDDVRFDTGENLMFSKHITIAAKRTLGFMEYFNYEPAEVRYVRNDSGEWVQLVTMIRWEGFLFPQPELGGVIVIKQRDGVFYDSLIRALFGRGELVKKEDFHKHPYLVRQNLVPAEVSMRKAESMRFQNGFFAPFPGNHKGDIRIPDLPGELSDQPAVVYFMSDSGTPGALEGKLYHYYGLEPYDPDRQGLHSSLLVPSDGLGSNYVYEHREQGEVFTGMSAIVAKIVESKKEFDWNKYAVAGLKPYVKKISGKPRFFWLATVVAVKPNHENQVVAGSGMPTVCLVDAKHNIVVWIDDPLHPEVWPEQLTEKLRDIW